MWINKKIFVPTEFIKLIHFTQMNLVNYVAMKLGKYTNN